MASMSTEEMVKALAISSTGMRQDVAGLVARLEKMEGLLNKTSSKVGQVSSQRANNDGYGSRRGGGARGGGRGGHRGRYQEKSEERKSGRSSQRSSQSKSKKRRKKTPLSKLPKDLLEANERDEYKNDIKQLRQKMKVDPKDWEKFTPEQKAFHNLDLKVKLDEIVLSRNRAILEKAKARLQKK